MEDWSSERPFYKKSLEIALKCYPSDHYNLSKLYSSVATMYQTLEDYSSGLPFHEKALEIL
ncbi:unnamed protein product, partial [Rotaria magnacalcarata]